MTAANCPFCTYPVGTETKELADGSVVTGIGTFSCCEREACTVCIGNFCIDTIDRRGVIWPSCPLCRQSNHVTYFIDDTVRAHILEDRHLNAIKLYSPSPHLLSPSPSFDPDATHVDLLTRPSSRRIPRIRPTLTNLRARHIVQTRKLATTCRHPTTAPR